VLNIDNIFETMMSNQLETPNNLEYKRGTVLIVDDLIENLQILNGLLSDEGYNVRSAINGKLAVNSARANPPDLVLLDVRMPGMDGYEACRLLKTDDRTKDVPVIFLSAAEDVNSKVNGLKAGAIDYITKPFEIEEILARVDTHLTIQRLQEKLKLKNRELKAVARQREEVEDIIRHDIKGPLLPIINFPGLIKKNSHLSEKQLKYLDRIEEAGHRILKLIDRSDFLIKMENQAYSVQKDVVDLIPIIESIRSELANESNKFHIKLRALLDNKPIDQNDVFMITGDEDICHTMLENLIKNAVEASLENQTVTISLKQSSAQEIIIHNQTMVPECIQDKFFDKYVTFGKKKGTGLGTYSAKLAAKTLRGKISMTTSEENGTQIEIQFPACT